MVLVKYIDLPKHSSGGFDHGDVDIASGKVFVAHTARHSIDIIDGEKLVYEGSIPGCPEASGVLCAQQEAITFAAARGTGKVLVINSKTNAVLNELVAGPRPNGLAWNPLRKLLLVADVEDYSARLIAPATGSTISNIRLPGRPRWCVYDTNRDRFLINIKDPAGVAILKTDSLRDDGFIPISVTGPHGLDIDHSSGRAFVACDGKAIVSVNLGTRQEEQKISIPGEPDVIWHNAASHLLYCAVANPGVIDLVDTNKMELVDKILTDEGTHTLVFDYARRRLYALMPKKCQAAVYNEVNVH